MNNLIYSFYDTDKYSGTTPLIFNSLRCNCCNSGNNSTKDNEQDKEIERLKKLIESNSEKIAKNADDIEANTEADNAREINIYYEEDKDK